MTTRQSESLEDFLSVPPLERVELVIGEEVKAFPDDQGRHKFLMDLRVSVERELRRMEWAAVHGSDHE